ncbi:MAG: hypothetical protein H0U35_10345 [Sporichthyaceae bacterium]|nr:hypothetical protein [Sporichthyaceae bacterium]
MAQDIFTGHMQDLADGKSNYRTPGRCLIDAHFTAMGGTMNRLAAKDPALRNWQIPASTYDAYLEALRLWARMTPEQLAEGHAELSASVEADRRRKAKTAEVLARLEAMRRAQPDQ